MALYRFAAGTISRGRGDSSTAAAAYRAGVLIVDERTGERHDYERRKGVEFSGVFLPKDAPRWDIGQLFNAAEAAEKRKDARVAREFVIAAPHELDLETTMRLGRDFIRENFTRKGFAAHLAIHAAPENGDERNRHMHIMVTTRTLDQDGFSKSKDRSQNEKATLEQWRESWEKLGNRYLREQGFEPTLDRRSYEAQGIARLARVHMGKAAWAMEREGLATDRGDDNRAIADREEERKRIVAELRELEVAERAELRPAIRAKLHELETGEAIPKSAVERQQREDQAERIQAERQAERELGKGTGIAAHMRELLQAVRRLFVTMGVQMGEITQIERGDLRGQGMTLRAEAIDERRRQAQAEAAARSIKELNRSAPAAKIEKPARDLEQEKPEMILTMPDPQPEKAPETTPEPKAEPKRETLNQRLEREAREKGQELKPVEAARRHERKLDWHKRRRPDEDEPV